MTIRLRRFMTALGNRDSRSFAHARRSERGNDLGSRGSCSLVIIGRECVRKEPGKEFSQTRSSHDRCRIDRMLTSTCSNPVRHAVGVTSASNASAFTIQTNGLRPTKATDPKGCSGIVPRLTERKSRPCRPDMRQRPGPCATASGGTCTAKLSLCASRLKAGRLRPRLAVWRSPRAATPQGKKRCRPKGEGQQVPLVMIKTKRDLQDSVVRALDFRGHLAVRRRTLQTAAVIVIEAVP